MRKIYCAILLLSYLLSYATFDCEELYKNLENSPITFKYGKLTIVEPRKHPILNPVITLKLNKHHKIDLIAQDDDDATIQDLDCDIEKVIYRKDKVYLKSYLDHIIVNLLITNHQKDDYVLHGYYLQTPVNEIKAQFNEQMERLYDHTKKEIESLEELISKIDVTDENSAVISSLEENIQKKTDDYNTKITSLLLENEVATRRGSFSTNPRYRDSPMNPHILTKETLELITKYVEYKQLTTFKQ